MLIIASLFIGPVTVTDLMEYAVNPVVRLPIKFVFVSLLCMFHVMTSAFGYYFRELEVDVSAG